MYVPHMSFEGLEKEEESAEAKALKKVSCRCSMQAKSLKIEPILATGTPHEEILRVAREKEVDMIVIGTAGTGGVGRVVFGSNADKLIRSAHVPVLAIPPGD
jgi:nucleotide-binding universal stress UspA family protein